MVQPVPEKINFAKEEEEILAFWKKHEVFQTSLKQSRNRPRYSFYDGPPFATGLPHYGHILAGTIKDIVPRFAHMSGFHVERRFGWDCHGLPVEFEIDKMLGIKGPEDVAKMGIAKYNAECRKIVMRYASEWEEIITRLGRWIDFRNDYKTMYPWFMETVWWLFKSLFDKGLVYKGFKVMPYSTACNTPLSNFESGQNYKDVEDPSVIVSFPLDEDPNVAMIAWTTTPWTLPSNLALVVNPGKDYVKFQDKTSKKIYIMMEARLETLYKSPEQYTVLERFKGETLKGKGYQPLFNYFAELKNKKAFCILCDTYVTDDSGTGVVHSAPYFGEEDFRVCLLNGIITRDQNMICPVDESGRFIDPVVEFKGLHVKDADPHIIKWIKNTGRLINRGTFNHSYPFCWRSDTPLIYKAVPSWFVRVEPLVDQLLENNQKTYWVPEFVKEKRFANWLKDARDWAVSRNRYWGTPIPLWVSDDGEEVVCIGSIKELENLTGQKITDLHRENVDNLSIPSLRGKGMLKRVPEVFDCWFESGSMPYSQLHYPFENQKEFEDSFPADFVAEGIDQTRGWFYTLLVLSTALFGKPPFKNLVCNGLILASDGQKMSKRKKNYPDPLTIVNQFGADALRLYLINSPAVRAENLRFKEEGVKDILKDVFLPWYNAYRFLVQNIERLGKEDGIEFKYDEKAVVVSDNIMDRWIVSFTQSLISFVKKEMKAYRLYTVVPQLVKFVDHLTNWYVRFNRRRLKGENGQEECVNALTTLFGVLFDMIRIMASFTPFLTELMYQNLRHLVDSNDQNEVASVHYLLIPNPRTHLIDERIERAVQKMQAVIDLGRILRERKMLPVKFPLPEVVVVHKDEGCLADIRSLEKYIIEELNVRQLTTTTDKKKYGVQFKAQADFKALGFRLKDAVKSIAEEIKNLSDEQITSFLETKKLEIRGHNIESSEIKILYTYTGEKSDSLPQFDADVNGDVLVLMNTKPDENMIEEGVSREVINRIQKLRKKANLVPLDAITVYYEVKEPTENVQNIVKNYFSNIENAIRAPLRSFPYPSDSQIIFREMQSYKDAKIDLVLVRGFTADWNSGDRSEAVAEKPFSSFVNVELCGSFANEKPNLGNYATIFVENPVGQNKLNLKELNREVQVVFQLQGREISLFENRNKSQEINTDDLSKFYGQTIFAFRRQDLDGIATHGNCVPTNGAPFCPFINLEMQNKSGLPITASVVLENPKNYSVMDFEKLNQQVASIYKTTSVNLCSSDKDKSVVARNENINNFRFKTLYVFSN